VNVVLIATLPKCYAVRFGEAYGGSVRGNLDMHHMCA
jgi:hypothetical protein